MSNSVEFEPYFFWSALTQTITFYARNGQNRIRCGVTRIALEDQAGAVQPLRPAELERAFEEHRADIERIARQKIAAKLLQGDGTVLIRSSDVEP